MKARVVSLGRRAALAALLAGSASLAAAQEGGRGFRTTLSVNPIGLPFGWYTAEFERQVNDVVSFGVVGGHLELDEGSHTSFDAKVRFYVEGAGPKGIALGLGAGFARLEEGAVRDIDPGLSLLADYNWLVGPSQRLLLGTGVGLKHILGVRKDFKDLRTTYPTLRLMFGMRF